MIKEIQGLRAIAILMVLFIHILGVLPLKYHHYIYDIQQIFFTSTGVEIFFVISGYLLMHSLDKFNKNTEYRIQNTEYRIQNTEYRIQNTEYRIQNTEYRIQ